MLKQKNEGEIFVKIVFHHLLQSNQYFKAWQAKNKHIATWKQAKSPPPSTSTIYHVFIPNATNGDEATLEEQNVILNEAYLGKASAFYPED